MHVDTLFIRGDITTFDPERPSATSLAVLGGRVLAVGDDDLVERFTADRVIDLGGRCVVPGF
ncbi:MAG: amidohydrolase, partial [Actinomycetota bacterium]|nr:amidohydrolase [Actinomycetota bacterium]